MTTSVTTTGTGTPIPDGNRAGPGALVRYNDITLQFDAGRSTVQRLAGADLWIPDLTAVFITHHHSDHVSGLTDLFLTHWNMDREDGGTPLPIIAPEGDSTEYIKTLLHGWDADIQVRLDHAGRVHHPKLDLRSFPVPDTVTEVWRPDGVDDVVVSAMQVRHEPVKGAVGYRVDTPDGSIAISGDTKVCDEVAELAEGVDVLVYEAMRFSFYDDLPPHRHYVMDYHADTKLIGAQAAELGVPTLVLTHLIPGPKTDEDRQLFIDDVRSGGYEGELIVADDLHTTTIG